MLYTSKLFEWIKFQLFDLDRRMNKMDDEKVLKELTEIIEDHINIIG